MLEGIFDGFFLVISHFFRHTIMIVHNISPRRVISDSIDYHGSSRTIQRIRRSTLICIRIGVMNVIIWVLVITTLDIAVCIRSYLKTAEAG